MAHDISEAKARLVALEAAEKKRKHKKAAHDLGFDVTGDYDAWKVLDDLRTATLRARREKAGTDDREPKDAGVGVTTVGGWTSLSPGTYYSGTIR